MKKLLERFAEAEHLHPGWLRHITPWWVLNWIDMHSGVCWTNLVLWKRFGTEGSWMPSAQCFYPYDYCNKFPERSTGERAVNEKGEQS